jgi:imidazolonepropionase-like amidohydrolase
MKNGRWILTLFAGIATLALAVSLAQWASARNSANVLKEPVLALVGAKIYPAPAEKPIPNGVVLVRGGKIVAVGEKNKVKIPAGASILDCSGKIVVAGFQNSHVHFTETKWIDAAHLPAAQITKQLQEMLARYGFTTVVDTGSSLANTNAIRARVESGEASGPRILTAGTPLYPEHGIPYYLKDSLPPDILKLLPQPATPEEAVAVVKQNIDGGADIIKLFTGSWISRGEVLPMRLDIVKAAVAEAHRHGRLVFTHPSNVEGLKVALDGGVDVLAHAIEDLRGWNDSYIPQMIDARMSLIPTLHLFSDDSDIEKILREVGDFSRAGGQILFGTDAGYLPDYDTSDELALMSRAGLSPMQILAALTTAPAARFKESGRRGKIAPGMDADLVVLNADPAADARNFANVQTTIRAGRTIYP